MDPVDLIAFVDGEVPPSRAAVIAAHVAGCESCRRDLDRARRVDDAVRRAEPAFALATMREDLLGRVALPRARLGRRLVVAAAAAAILIAFVFGLRLTTGRPDPRPASGGGAPPAPAIEALELDAASLRLSLIAEKPDPAVREKLHARLDAIVDGIEKLRAMSR
jgi:anti-sigma factor RsiW